MRSDARDRRSTRLRVACALAIGTTLSPLSAASAACSDRIFVDAFESGDTSRWSNSPDPATATGTWLFSLDFDGTVRPFALELIERSNGSVVGYLLGGTASRTVVSGSVAGGTLSLVLELANPSAVRTISLTGALDRTSVSGTATGDIATQPFTLRRSWCALSEQQLAAAVLGGEPDPEHVVWLAAVLDEEGNFVAGGWAGADDCGLWACDGGLTSYSEIGDVLTVGLETDGGCSAGSSFTATWTPLGVFDGTYSFTDCIGTTTGNLIAATSMGTTSGDAREVLAARISVADALEAGVPLTAPPEGVSAGFLYFGKDEPDLRAELNDEMSRYAAIAVDLARVQQIFTFVHPRALPDLVTDFGLRVAERRTGTPTARVGDPVTYYDLGARPVIDELGILADGPGGWQITGNQAPGLDLPFASTVPAGGTRLAAPTPGGTVWVSLGPYGTHFGPLTGDPSGEAKANLVGFLAEDDGDMEELVGDGDGIREEGETWGFPVGGDLTGDAVRLRRPPYIAPLDATVTSVLYEQGPSPFHFDNEPQWKVEIELPGGVRYAMGHVGVISPPLRALVLAATGIDTDTFAGPPGAELLEGFDPLPVAAGTELAKPQLLADAVPGFPGYFVGGGSFLEWPWAQIEYQVRFSLGNDMGADFCTFRFFTPDRQAELQAVADADMLDPDSQRYRDRIFYERWHWTAQGSLCQAENPFPRDFSDLYTRLGGWIERLDPGLVSDELFGFIPIDRASAVYDPANYDSPAVTHLVLRNHQPTPYSWTMPDATTAIVFVAVGEVLERDADSMLIKWRDLNATNPVVYQRVSYRLDSVGLTAEWGNFASTPGGAVLPTLLPGDPCDETTVLCYDHHLGAWPP